MFELFLSFIIGIASGIISSIIVTVIYRKIDQEKERQQYFSEIKLYVKKLIHINTSDLTSLENYWKCNEYPTLHKWIHLKNYEKKIIQDLNIIIEDLSKTMTNYFIDKASLLKQGTNAQDTNCILVNNYTPTLLNIIDKIIPMLKNIISLGT